MSSTTVLNFCVLDFYSEDGGVKGGRVVNGDIGVEGDRVVLVVSRSCFGCYSHARMLVRSYSSARKR